MNDYMDYKWTIYELYMDYIHGLLTIMDYTWTINVNKWTITGL